ncbi:peptidoglycan DD-metalloendopeptidase family protein [Clostridium sp. D2Q-11]|uniref:Peptidoglycan DD-metalloendopeptidase family protein n=1 Tax=Anaeromonas frigoriresistens TaxID=2683708 RepID=A0A942UQH4_9FIRM|nr:M23 family metallopeptidase [Anaeromonas frigoriresistens]MBS4537419.1 peptidoglycan DD-metalloendopeptidase family protein [Anaeromonas frigoriresistens]
MKKEKILSLLIALAIFSNVGFAYAGDVDSLKEKQKEVKSELKETKDKLADKEGEMSAVKKEIEKLDTEINEASKRIKEVEERISKVLGDIDKTEEELVEAQKNIDIKNDTLNARLRVMYKNGNASYLEVLFGAESFTDLLSRLDLVQRIADQDVELLRYMQEQRDIIEDKKEDLERQKKLLDHQQNEVKIQKDKLKLANRSKQNQMNKLKKEHSKLEKLEDQLNNEANKVTNDIKKLQSPTKEYVGGVYKWPVPGKYRVSSPFGYRIHPIFGTRKMHTGIDISYGGQYGPTVVAANSGTVIFAGWKNGYGNTVMVDHGGQMVTLYAHNQSLLVSVGQNVNAGQAIARGGSSGNSTGPHLHFEVRKNGQYVNPLSYLK